MTQAANASQEDLRARIEAVMEFAQSKWDVTNPTYHDIRVFDLAIYLFNLVQSGKTHQLDDLLALIKKATGEEGQTFHLLAAISTSSREFQLVKYLLGDGRTMPALPEVAARLVELAAADTQPSTAPADASAAPATSDPEASASRPSPREFLNRLRRGSASTANAPEAAAPTPVEPVATPVAPATTARHAVADPAPATPSGRKAARLPN